MQLYIPKNEAISIIRERIKELYTFDFDAHVWQKRTEMDMKEIFGLLSDQQLQISYITFDAAFDSAKQSILSKGKERAAGLLNSYIEMIEEYSRIGEQANQIKEQKFERQYSAILAKHNALLDQEKSLKNANLRLANELEALSAKNRHLEENTLQLDNITLKRLWQAIQNLPAKQVWAVIGVLIGLLIATFFFGEFIQRNFYK